MSDEYNRRMTAGGESPVVRELVGPPGMMGPRGLDGITVRDNQLFARDQDGTEIALGDIRGDSHEPVIDELRQRIKLLEEQVESLSEIVCELEELFNV